MTERQTATPCERCKRPIPDDVQGVCPACGWSATEVSGLPALVSHRKVMFRDLLIFQLKLFLDGMKDFVLAPMSLIAFVFDLLPGRKHKGGKAFYGVIRAGEKFDRWLSLYNATERADPRTDGLFGESLAGANNLIGKMEEVVRQTVEVGAETVGQARERRANAKRPKPDESEDS